VGAAQRLIVAAALAGAALAAAPGVAAQALEATGSCRDGLPHGAYELRGADGRLRVSGAFNRGKRTSSFLFWTAAGVRIAHLPYDDGMMSGTVSLWYSDAPLGAAPQQKLEAVYAAGTLVGTKRSWHANGRPRARFVYDDGMLVEAQAWSATGAKLRDDAARALALRDAAADRRYYGSLDAIVDAHPPPCDGAAPSLQSADAAR
jgi:antitoxin component YwqK of YwqJK toxin-antitoxin module